MRLSEVSSPFERVTTASAIETTASAVATETMLDRIEGTALADSSVVLDGKLPPQEPIGRKLVLGLVALLGTLGVLAYFARENARRQPTPEQDARDIARGQDQTRREIRRVVKKNASFQRRMQQA